MGLIQSFSIVLCIYQLYGCNVCYGLQQSHSFSNPQSLNGRFAVRSSCKRLMSTTENNVSPSSTKLVAQTKRFRFGNFDETINALLYTDKESNRKFRRTVFTKHNWQRHRSSNRYFLELRNMPKSVILRGLGLQTLVVTFFSFLIVSYNTFVEMKTVSFPLPLLSFPALPFALTSSSLGLLLVFRTNAAYSRWKDARVSWALISARAFDLMRQAMIWIPSTSCKSRLIRYTTAFAKVAKWHLGHQGNDKRLRGDLDMILTAGETDRFEIFYLLLTPPLVLICVETI
jgi:Bestrophin, RFP-TM, chloride channel